MDEALVTERTGLLLDPYFSGTKLSWLLDNVTGSRAAAENGDLLAGTIDSYLIWRLTKGRNHVTDATNASRTLLFDIERQLWDDELLDLFDIPESVLPEVLDCAAHFGSCDKSFFGAEIPICGVAGDQQAATIGQACFSPGMLKSTYGTGCFALLNTGEKRVYSNNRLLSTIAYRLNGKTTYALEGSIFVAGAAVQWLRDGLRIIHSAEMSGELAEKSEAEGDQLYMIPAFVGLGAPHWEPEARGAIFGLTRNSSPADFARAALESVAFQTRDLLDAMHGDWQGTSDTVLRVDGGMVASGWTMQRLADILNAPVDRPDILETTAFGAAWLAGSHIALWPDMADFAQNWSCERRFEPLMDSAIREAKISGWKRAISATLQA
ncbi:glycerol kinase [Limoniibacter endophyticus]|uniref:glycerol kinase n=1 Tax=Limoniibacter endophyticus TaxID=1565040 RepID=A0A8J3DEM9_9HYPH|nr:glycerol kinase [Limoniibacter endophyticus]